MSRLEYMADGLKKAPRQEWRTASVYAHIAEQDLAQLKRDFMGRDHDLELHAIVDHAAAQAFASGRGCMFMAAVLSWRATERAKACAHDQAVAKILGARSAISDEKKNI